MSLYDLVVQLQSDVAALKAAPAQSVDLTTLTAAVGAVAADVAAIKAEVTPTVVAPAA